jgi:excinuclease ABC subunit A
MADLLDDGNSVVFVDHDVRVLRRADHLVEIGPASGSGGGTVVASGTVADLQASGTSRLAGFLTGEEEVLVRDRPAPDEVFTDGRIRVETSAVHTVHPLTVEFPLGRLTAVTGMSGSGKTTLVLESLVPALRGDRVPHVAAVEAPTGTTVHVVDATPIGINVRSTVATYSGVMDDLRAAFARLPEATEDGLTASDFSYNTGSRERSLACPRCEGTGQISLDVQFLPDIDVPCPDCRGTRYSPDADRYRREGVSLPELLAMTVDEALEAVPGLKRVQRRLAAFAELGLGYLTLGEATPALSGGEAQRLKLVNEIHRDQSDAVFVLDEPSVGLHPLDVRTLLEVLQRLCDRGATVLVIEHDLDMIANADFVVDMGPGGGTDGGQIVATGTPEQVAGDDVSATGGYLRTHLYGEQHDNYRSR